MKSIEELIPLIEEWADNKGLLKPENAEKQYLKFLEELGETAKALLKNDEAEIKDGFGDVAVTIIILANQLGVAINTYRAGSDNVKSQTDALCLFITMVSSFKEHKFPISHSLSCLDYAMQKYGYDLEECLNIAWDEIKDRTGKTKDGIFVKD